MTRESAMSRGTVLISTHRLALAGRLRDTFEAERYSVDLVPQPDGVDAVEEPRLLILTGERGEGELAEWIASAERASGIPVLAFLSGKEARLRAREAGASEVFDLDADLGEVALLGHRSVERRRLQRLTGIVGESEAMREVLERVVQIAPVESTVLITGESGTGKELVARGIHALSSRRSRSFLAVNVAALSETLLESELFGHEKGAFTGAIDSRKGFFELAHGGTLFLDEIGEMPLSTQTKLLRVLEQREFLRVGGQKSIRVDVRIITATNQELRQLVTSGQFRRDLYYRLNILNIELPPLRRRREDVPPLIRHFVRELAERIDRPFPGISEPAMETLMKYEWPGNVRELRNLIESMVVLSPGREIGPEDIPSQIRSPEAGRSLLPVPVAPSGAGAQRDLSAARREEGRSLRPELEFVFRTLVELRVDMDQLRQDFEVYREEIDDRLDDQLAAPSGFPLVLSAGGESSERWADGDVPESGESREMDPEHDLEGEKDAGAEEAVVFEPGMTMEELEEEAIRVVLGLTAGNRRKAAESLGIGERTLYRKIRKYGIEA